MKRNRPLGVARHYAVSLRRSCDHRPKVRIRANRIEVGLVGHQRPVVVVQLESPLQIGQRLPLAVGQRPIASQIVTHQGVVRFGQQGLFQRLDGQVDPPVALVAPTQRQPDVDVARIALRGRGQRFDRLAKARQYCAAPPPSDTSSATTTFPAARRGPRRPAHAKPCRARGSPRLAWRIAVGGCGREHS